MADQGMEKIFHNVYDTGESFRAHHMPLSHHKNGRLQLGYFDFVYQPQRDIQGNIIGVAVIATDVTEQTQLHQQIKEDERKFRQMADLTPDMIATTNRKSVTTYYNQSWLNYTGYSLDQLKAKGWETLVHKDDLPKLHDHLKRSSRKKIAFELELRLLSKEAEYKWHLLRAVPVRNDRGKLKSWLSSSTEIHKIKEEEKRKEAFLKMVSHELKTPVTSIKGYIQLLLAMLESEEEKPTGTLPLKSSLKRIDSQVSRLTRLISEMLDLTRVEEDRLDLQKETFNINGLVEECVQDITHSNLNSRIKIIQDDHFKISGDKDRIGQVIINFITNAIKYSPNKEFVEVRVFKSEDGAGSVSVRDYGIGINKKDRKNIFKRFYRVSGKNEETYSGFGIGLYLAMEIVQRHHGNIEVKSEPGEGSEFIFSLPIVEEEVHS